jgi:hypothetical protein
VDLWARLTLLAECWVALPYGWPEKSLSELFELIYALLC